MHDQLLDAVRDLAPRVRLAADDIEANRGLPLDLVRELARTGCFRMLVPRALGGAEVGPLDMVRVLEELARADGSTGWCAMVGATSGLLLAYLEEDVAREIFDDPDLVLAGVFAPMGAASLEGDAYRARGRWPFASGVEHSTWRMGGVVVGSEVRHLLFHRDQTEVEDTWRTLGLRGTGSHDLVVRDALVPVRRAVTLAGAEPRHPGALYRFPLFGLLALGVAAVALGIARTSIETLTSLAREKRPGGGKRTLAERESTQIELARAEATLRSARAFLVEATEAAHESAEQGRPLSLDQRAELRLAATHATRASAECTNRMYEAGGASSVYASCLLQRCFRDVHVATQHAMVAPSMYAGIGRVMLGLTQEASHL